MPDKDKVYSDFDSNVNMTPQELADFLETDKSQSVGIKKNTKDDTKSSSGGAESTGHKSGKEIVKILNKNKSDLTDADYSHMKKVNGYIKRHLAQKPSKNIGDSRWRYSLMNWGHDPLK